MQDELHKKLLDTVEYLHATEQEKKAAVSGYNEAIKGAKAQIVEIARCLKSGEAYKPETLFDEVF